MDFSLPGLPVIGAVVPGKSPATCMSYHAKGKRLFVASEQDSRLQVIDCINGKADQPAFKLERENIHAVEATHHENCVLFAGKGSPAEPVSQRNVVNYLSTYDNKMLRKFRGHSDVVTSMSMCPADDTFLSCSADRTVRLWNLQSAGSMAECKLPPTTETTGTPMAVFDSTGLVFAIAAAMASSSSMSGSGGVDGHYVHLYDARNYSAGAFAEFKISRKDLEKNIMASTSGGPQAADLSRGRWHSIQFNVSGNQILVGADKGLSIVLDGFEGTIQRTILASAVPTNRPTVCCFSTDEKTILTGGTDDRSLSCWSAETGNFIKKIEGHKGPVNCLACNPVYQQFASSCKDTALWSW